MEHTSTLHSAEENKKYLDLFQSLISQDHGLTPEEKEVLLTRLHEPGFLSSLMAGSTGAGLAYATAKYLKLSPTARFLLTVSGFGIGKYLLEKTQNHDTFVKYNKNTKLYHLNT